jgi:hypothetical protein
MVSRVRAWAAHPATAPCRSWRACRKRPMRRAQSRRVASAQAVARGTAGRPWPRCLAAPHDPREGRRGPAAGGNLPHAPGVARPVFHYIASLNAIEAVNMTQYLLL